MPPRLTPPEVGQSPPGLRPRDDLPHAAPDVPALPEEPFDIVEFLGALPHLIWSARLKGEIDYVSGRYRDYAPFAAGPDRSWQLFSIVHPDDRDATLHAWAESVRSGRPCEMTHRLRKRDGDYAPHLTRATLVRDSLSGSPRWYGTATEIEPAANGGLRRDRPLQDAAGEAEGAQLDRLTFALEHDIRAPVRAMSGFAALLARREAAALSDDGRCLLHRLCASATFVDQVVEALLELSRLAHWTPRRRPVHVADAWRLACEHAADEINRAGACVEQPDKLPVVRSDLHGLSAVLRELLGNAIKFSRQSRPPKVRLEATTSGGRCRLTIADNGCGLLPLQAKHLFREQVGLRVSTAGGSGYGLLLARCRARKIGAVLGADCCPAGGARIYVELPLAGP